MCSIRISVCFAKLPGMVIYIVKMRVWNGSQTMWDSFQTFVFNAENLPLIVSRTLHERASLCMHHGHARRLIPTRIGRGFSWLYLSKNRFICSLKVIFSILTFLKSI